MAWDCACTGPGACPRLDNCQVNKTHYAYCSGIGTKLPVESREFYLNKLLERCHRNKDDLPKTGGQFLQKNSTVGDELRDLINDLGVKKWEGCGCEADIFRINSMPVEVCVEKRGEIAALLMRKAASLGLIAVSVTEKLLQQPWFNKRHPFLSIVDEAIRRAKAKDIT